MSEIIVRPAVVADAPGIAHVHVAAWREAYAQIFPAEFLASLDEQRRAASWARLIDSSETRVWAAELDGTIVGWITTGDGRDEDAPVDQELEGIYTLAAVHGSGAGQSLLDTALGASAAYLWVLEDNPRAGVLPAQRLRARRHEETDHDRRDHGHRAADGALAIRRLADGATHASSEACVHCGSTALCSR